MSYYSYMLRSESSGRHYYGYTSDLEQRLKSHNTSQNKSTRGKGPWVLVGFKECATKSEAMKVELKLKKMKNPVRARNWLAKSSSAR